MRRLLFNLHLIVGLSLGLLIALIGLTGSLLVFRHEIDRALYPGLRTVEVQEDRPRVPLQTVLETVRAAYPDRAIMQISMAQAANETHEVWLDAGKFFVYVDPYTGRIRGAVDTEQTATGWLFSLHMTLLSGDNGQRIVGYGGLGLLFLSLSGVFLWWPSRVRQIKDRLRVRWGASGKRVNYDLHRSGGFYAAGFLALIALTGSALAFGEWFTEAAYRVTRTAPRPKAPVVAAPPTGAKPLPVDTLVEAVNWALPGGLVTRVTLPSKPTAPLRVRKRLPGELHPNGMNFIHVDPYRGTVLQVDGTADVAAGARLLNLRYPLHIGHYGGLLTQVIYALAGLAPLGLFVTGCLMWWNRVGSKRFGSKRFHSKRSGSKRPPVRQPEPGKGGNV